MGLQEAVSGGTDGWTGRRMDGQCVGRRLHVCVERSRVEDTATEHVPPEAASRGGFSAWLSDRPSSPPTFSLPGTPAILSRSPQTGHRASGGPARISHCTRLPGSRPLADLFHEGAGARLLLMSPCPQSSPELLLLGGGRGSPLGLEPQDLGSRSAPQPPSQACAWCRASPARAPAPFPLQ